MCHHYKGSRNPPEHLADEFSIRSNHYQMLIPDAGYYPLKQVPVIRLDASWLNPEAVGRQAVEHLFASTDPALMVKRVK